MGRGLIALCATLAACRFNFDPVASAVDADPNPEFDAPRGSPDVDSDGDGVFDDTDNCISIGNAAQHDEDADGYGDACDNCPTVANVNQANGDADPVGDACDPRPTQGGDSLTYFEPFTSTTADWTAVNGSWLVTADEIAQMSLVSDQRIHNAPAAPGPNYIVEATFTFAGLDTGNVNGGVVFRMTNDNGWLCAVFHDDTTTPPMSLLMMWSLQNGAANFERNRAVLPAIAVGSRYRILTGGYGSSLYCALDSLQTGPSAPFTSNQNNDGIPGLRTNRVTGAYSSFVVYTLGGPI